MDSQSRQTPIPDDLFTKSSSPSGTTSCVGTKRKRTPEPKFYSVRVGFEPGIYHSWSDCLAQVKGHKGATFKSFTSLGDAESFLAGDTPTHDPNSRSLQSQKFYAVQSGRAPGVYTDWPSAQKQITGWARPKHKLFSSRTEAERFVKAGDHDMSSEPSVVAAKSKPPAAKRTNKSGASENSSSLIEAGAEPLEPGTGPLPLGAEDGFDPRIILDPESGNVVYKTDDQKALVKLKATGERETGTLRIYTDGSSLGNGALGAKAGVGVYFGPDDARNISEPLPGSRQTNQRAELTAVSRALDIAPRHRDVAIFTDSKYAIDCVTVWYMNWRRNNWMTAAKKPVENKDLIEGILCKMEERTALEVTTKFQWIKGHANEPGNVAADLLAVNGAMRDTLRG